MGIELKELAKSIYRGYPLTATGTLLFAAAIYLLGLWKGSGNAYAFIFGASALAVLILLVSDGYIQKFRFRHATPVLDSSHSVFARLKGQVQAVHLGDQKCHYFYRFHFVIRGPFSVGRDSSFSFRAEGASPDGSLILVPLNFPYSGRGIFKGSLLLRDVFGLVRFFLGEDERVEITVEAPLFPEKAPVHFQPASSMESSRKMQTSEEEKYYMREYIPGDRLKDINWKSSIRIQELITRISPISPEQSHLLHLDFRAFNDQGMDSPEAILHLNYLKSWFISFVRVVHRDHPEYRFRVRTPAGSALLESDEDLDRFSRELAALQYFLPGQEAGDVDAPRTGERFIFTTGFDNRLNSFLQEHSAERLNIFGTVRGPGREVRFLPDWDLSCFPGFWIFRRHKAAQSLSAPSGGNLVEEKLRLRLV
ncbi:MAG TPA: hypothetical protein DEA96_17360 [Leptospiraceae bacterium]|nr:hypothetical protein [Spirochaetaceae bacterium]HBS06741.1 hypothetical protein [Leptospiraceae bacterium]|tara:strand:+ start:869 stop:2134 length:1266 start_codon:yes stop_codon:yes gene_type:complete